MRSPGLRWRRPAGRPITAFLIGIALILGAPSGSIVPGQSPPVWTQAQVVVESAVALLSILVPVMALLAAVILVRSYWGDRRWETLAPKDGREVHPRLGIRLLSALLFTAFVVGPDGFFFGLPLTLALAWAVVPRLLLRDTQVETLAQRAAKIRRTRRSTIPIWVEKPGPKSGGRGAAAEGRSPTAGLALRAGSIREAVAQRVLRSFLRRPAGGRPSDRLRRLGGSTDRRR